MGTDIKLKDLFGQTQTEQDISTVSVPKADGTGREFYVKRPVIYYRLVSSPPYAPQEGDSIIIYWNLGDGGLDYADEGNSLGRYHAAVDGKTTKPIVRVAASKYLDGISADNSGYAQLIYLEEAVPGQTLIDVLFGVTGTADFTAQPGWGQIIQGTDGQTYTYTQLTDLSGIAIGIEQPNNILSQRLFFSYLTEKTNSAVAYTAAKNGEHTIVPPAESSGISTVNLTVDVPEPNLQDKSVAITENGTQEFSPDTGYDGIKKLTAMVNVAGGGGTGVQPDYAQNNTNAADYIKNRPGGYMVENPAISKTMTAADYRSDDPDSDGRYKFSDIALPDEAILNATGKVKIVAKDGTETEHDINSIVFDSQEAAIKGYKASIVGSAYTLNIISGSMPDFGYDGTYIDAKIETTNDVTTVVAYISQFTSAPYPTTVEIPEKFTEVKTANWGSGPDDPGYIPGRPGGYFPSTSDFIRVFQGGFVYTWDGVIDGKEVVETSINETPAQWVKIRDDTPPPLLYVGGSAEMTTVISEKTSTSAATFSRKSIVVDPGGLVLFTIVGSGGNGDPVVCMSYGNPGFFTEVDAAPLSQGVWFLRISDESSGRVSYVSRFAPPNNITDLPTRMPYELIEQNPNTLTTDAQTLTDAQKLQARTNIGLTDDYINALIDAKIKAMQSGS